MRFRAAKTKLSFLLGLCWVTLPTLSRAVEPFEVLQRNCVECHNAHDKKGGVVLDRGPVVIDDRQLIVKWFRGIPRRCRQSGILSRLRRSRRCDRGWLAELDPRGRVLTDTRIADRQWWSLKPCVNL